jgi:hypothetical protein
MKVFQVFDDNCSMTPVASSTSLRMVANHVAELVLSLFRDDWHVVGIPLDKGFAFLPLLPSAMEMTEPMTML